jgi:uncharacterized protein DUF87
MNIIPPEALKNHIAILGKTGAGKTSTEKLIVEKVVADDFRVCILDSVKSDWWGITSSADGKRAGLPFKILGGPRGHVPLHSSAGKVIGQLVGSGKLPLSIIDMADFEAGGLQRFFVEFAQSLMRSARGVIYLVIEEAHEFAPKERSGIGAENLAIHWAKKLATAGRSKGIRLIVATQRIQALHNAVLGSCETIIAHRLSAPADQEPVIKWLKANADKEMVEKVASSLSSLPTGTAWVCSGEAKAFEIMKFPKFKTYDNTATPTGDAAEITVKTAPVNQDELRAIIGDAVTEFEANDPAKLKAKIRELERRAPLPAAVDEKALERAHVTGRTEGYDLALTDFGNAFPEAMAELSAIVVETISHFKFKRSPNRAKAISIRIANPIKTPIKSPCENRAAAIGDLSRPEQRIVDSLAFWLGIGKEAPTRQQVAAVAGYSPKSSGFSNLVYAMHTKGIITYPGKSLIKLVDSSGANVMDPETAKQTLRGTLTAPQRKIVDAFSGTQESRAVIAERSGYSPTSSGYSNLIYSLAGIGVIVYPSPGMVDLAHWVRELL